MSGIAGVFDLEGNLPPDSALQEALTAMRHRGADAISMYRDGCCLMGLSAFDPSDDGRHPGKATDPESKAVVFLDGVLDSVDLAGPKSSEFVRSVIADPEGTVKALHGDFALAAWCPQRRRLILARDHLGTRPLCVARHGKRILFASTPRAVVALGHPAGVDLEAIGMILQLAIMPSPWSGWAGIERLGPSEMLVADAGGSEKRTYWKLHLAERSDLTEAQQVQRVRRGLEEAIEDQLAGVADPIFCMSGGIDSTAVAGIGRRMMGRPIRTVCLGFRDSLGDDRPHARMASKYLDTKHMEMEVTAERVADQLDEIARVLEVPSLLSFAEFFLSREIGGSTRLLVTGETADSQFCGTALFVSMRRVASYQCIPRFVRRPVASLLRKALSPSVRMVGKHPGMIIRFLDDADRGGAVGRYLANRQIFTYEQAHRLLGGATLGRDNVATYLGVLLSDYEDSPANGLLAAMIRHECPNEYLRDEMKLSSPVVYRSPYASRRVAEISSSIPPQLKLRGKVQKHVLIEAVRDVLPPETITRRKMGFSLPIERWLRGPLRERLEAGLSPAAIPDFMDRSAVITLRDQYLAGRPGATGTQALLLLLISLWWRTHLA